MEIEQTPVRTAIMRIMSDMLDNPDKHGIYETGRFMDRIEQLICDMMAAPEVMQLSGSEAVMGFLAWLTTRDETTVLGPTTVVDISLYQQFVDANHLTEPRAGYSELLVHPDPPPLEVAPEAPVSQQPFFTFVSEDDVKEDKKPQWTLRDNPEEALKDAALGSAAEDPEAEEAPLESAVLMDLYGNVIA